MQRFRGAISAFVGLLLVFLMLGVGSLWATALLPSQMPWPDDRAARWMLALLFGPTGLGCAWYYGWGLLEWFTVYEVDAAGITRRAWNGRRRMRWLDVTHFKASGHKDGTVTLRDSQNQKLSICFSLLSASSNDCLRELLASRLAPLRERQRREIPLLNTVYRPNRAMRILAGALSLLLGVLCLGGAVTLASGRAPDRVGEVLLGGIALFPLLFGGGMLLLGLTHTLTVTQNGVTQSNCFGSRTLLFPYVAALLIREVTYKGDRWEVTRLMDADGRKIQLNSKMTDYPLLVEFIRAHVPPAALSQGDMQVEKIRSKERRQERIIVPVCAVILGVGCTAVSVCRFADAAPALVKQSRINARMGAATGRITRIVLSRDKNQASQIEFTFKDAQGRSFAGVSPVAMGEYQDTRAGDPVAVEYASAQPDLCRLKRNISTRRAVVDLVIVAIGLLYAVFFMPYTVYTVLRKKNALAAIESADVEPTTDTPPQ